jgi:hypothetical protein
MLLWSLFLLLTIVLDVPPPSKDDNNRGRNFWDLDLVGIEKWMLWAVSF